MPDKIKQTLDYEIGSTLESFKKTGTWMNILAIISLISVLVESYLISLLSILAILLLRFKLDYEEGHVLDYYRRKNNIPNATRIREMKNASKETK